MDAKSASAALMVMTAVQVPGIFGTWTPDTLTIAKSNRNTDTEVYNQLRRGQAEALVITLLLGGATSAVAKTPWPLIGCAAMALYLIWKQENALNKETAS
jgi:hypothetical protein